MKKQCAIFIVSICASLNSIASTECLSYEPNIAESNVNEVTLVFLGEVPNIKNKRIKVSGSVFHAHTGHHRTPLLITVASVDVVSK